jgi:uncharacterized protein (DUF885 family)
MKSGGINMKTSKLNLLAVLSLTVLATLAPWMGAVSAPAVDDAPPAQVSADQVFTGFVDRYFAGLFHFDPARATEAGLHTYDAELPASSRREIEAEIARAKRALAELAGIPKEPLARENQFDAVLLENSIRAHLLDLENIRMWEKDPDFYNGVISQALFLLVQRDFAPLDERLRSLIARERQVPEILRSARANLTNPPAIYTKIATLQVASEIRFLRDDLPRAIAGAKDARLKAEFAQVNQRAIEEYEKFLEYLRTDLASRSQGSFAIGAENYRKKLLYEEMVDIPLDRLLEIGEKALRQTQDNFKATAALIDSEKPPAAVMAQLSQDHPDAEKLIAETQAGLEDLRNFVTSHRIVTIPSPENPRVTETPAFMRALTFASMDSPGAFEETSTEAFYNVTLPEPDWSATQREEHLRAFSRNDIRMTSIHEVFPGHYTQFLWVRRAPTKVRKLLGADTNAEGWAHYAEQMMLEEGYGEGDPKLLLSQLHEALLRLCRYIVGLRMHTRGMTLEEGIAFFEQEGYPERVNAEREAMRGTSDPTYLVYTLGKLQLLKLREDYQKKVGDQFKLKEFHDRFLGFGYPPIKLIRKEMLGDDSPTL